MTKKYWVPVKFTVTTEVEADVCVEAKNEKEALDIVNRHIEAGDHKQVMKKIDNTDYVYDQCSDSAEFALAGHEKIPDLKTVGDVSEADVD